MTKYLVIGTELSTGRKEIVRTMNGDDVFFDTVEDAKHMFENDFNWDDDDNPDDWEFKVAVLVEIE